MKTTTFSVIVIILILIGAIISYSPNKEEFADTKPFTNVSEVNGKQVIEINAKGGYFPRETLAKSGVPTVIKMKTNGTYDCSSALVIPDLDYQKYLPPTGETLIDIPPQESGFVLSGLCSMGMYGFAIKFD